MVDIHALQEGDLRQIWQTDVRPNSKSTMSIIKNGLNGILQISNNVEWNNISMLISIFLQHSTSGQPKAFVGILCERILISMW